MEKKSSANSMEQNVKEKESKKQFGDQTGYGDKKLEGPNRPST
jgi:hypothetical protein